MHPIPVNYCLVWKHNQAKRKWIVKTKASKITVCNLPSLDFRYTKCIIKRENKKTIFTQPTTFSNSCSPAGVIDLLAEGQSASTVAYLHRLYKNNHMYTESVCMVCCIHSVIVYCTLSVGTVYYTNCLFSVSMRKLSMCSTVYLYWKHILPAWLSGNKLN